MSCYRACTGDCVGTCSGNCYAYCSDNTCGCASCSTGCEGCGNCDTRCGNACTQGCSSSCNGCSVCSGCGGACSYSCSGCSGSCGSNCGNGCSKNNLTDIYTNLVLQTLIKSQDIINLAQLVRNETERRNLSLSSPITITQGEKISRDIIDEIMKNLQNTAGIPGYNYNTGDKADRNEILDYISTAKSLYEQDLSV